MNADEKAFYTALGETIVQERIKTNDFTMAAIEPVADAIVKAEKDISTLKQVTAKANSNQVLRDLQRIYGGNADLQYALKYCGGQMSDQYLQDEPVNPKPEGDEEEEDFEQSVINYGRLILNPTAEGIGDE